MSLVGYSQNGKRSQLSTWDHTVAGGLSGSLGRLLLQPLDVAKIRLQLQVEKGTSMKYSGLASILLTMPKEEGFTSLWKGHISAQLLSVTYGVVSFGAFEALTKLYYTSGWSVARDPAYKPVQHFVCGSIGGCAATFVSFPFDVIRTRMVAQTENAHSYSSLRDAANKLHLEGGIRALYKGIGPTLLAIGPQTGFQFGFYALFSQLLDKLVTTHDSKFDGRVMTVVGSLSCGGLAGVCAKLLVYPLDTVKKRLQISGWTGRQGLGDTYRYQGAVNCLGTILKIEGVRGLFKGLSPALLKSAASSSVHFWLYEHICYLLALRFHLDNKRGDS